MVPSTAAFFRVEGTLLRRPTAFTVAWLAANAQELGGRISRLGALGLALPLLGADRGLGRRLQWSALRGMSEDRLVVLGEELYATWLQDDILPIGRDLLERARRDGRRIVLVSDNLDVVVEHLARDLGVADWRANRLELRNGRATGRLMDPVVSTLAGSELREWADTHGLDLRQSSGYGASAEDAVLLSAVGLPCAVGPDRGLRRLASEHGWPVVNA
ncbi:MAG: HAD family phosphatase [Myxococcales bacterium]|nr:HAD family phosphatase [Myxococcales bacterium]MCB9691609.1 HAD family phosphatase [Alphaproteobacteria bacterium]